MVGVPYESESDYVLLINATKAEKEQARKQRQQADLAQSTGELIFDVF